MDEETCNKCKTVKDTIRELNCDLAVTNSLYSELTERTDKIGRRIFELKKEIDNLEDRKD